MPSEPVFRAGRARASSASRRKLVVSLIGGGTRALEAAGGGGDGTALAPRLGPGRPRPVPRNMAVAPAGEPDRQPPRGALGPAGPTTLRTPHPPVDQFQKLVNIAR